MDATLQDRIDALEAELARIKEGIKRNKIAIIVDGNDMIDWGWTTHYDVNTSRERRIYNWLEKHWPQYIAHAKKSVPAIFVPISQEKDGILVKTSPKSKRIKR